MEEATQPEKLFAWAARKASVSAAASASRASAHSLRWAGSLGGASRIEACWAGGSPERAAAGSCPEA
eukprot:7766437-Pyramimonas_sp.AAC.1